MSDTTDTNITTWYQRHDCTIVMYGVHPDYTPPAPYVPVEPCSPIDTADWWRKYLESKEEDKNVKEILDSIKDKKLRELADDMMLVAKAMKSAKKKAFGNLLKNYALKIVNILEDKE